MKNQPTDDGRIGGFKHPSDGFHLCEFLEGIELMMKDGQPMLTTKKSNKQWKFPAKVNDENDADHGLDCSIPFIAEDDWGEKRIANILHGAGLFADFEKHFPGDRSFFETAIMDKIKMKLPGKFAKIEVETNANGQLNILTVKPVSYNPEADKKAEKGKAAGKGKTADKQQEVSKGEGKAPAGGDGWD
jgi:hypothetical protein